MLTGLLNRFSRLIGLRTISQLTRTHVENIKTLEDVPGPKGLYTLPYIGMLFLSRSLGMLKNFEFHIFAARIQKEYGDIVRIRIKNKWSLFIFHPEIAKDILEIQTKYPVSAGVEVYRVYNKHRNLYPALATLQGEEWAKLRKPTQELILRPAAVSTYVGTISKVADDFVEKHKNGGVIEDFKHEITKYITESTGMLCFNKRLGCIDGMPVLDNKYLDDIFDAIDQDLKKLGPGLYRYISTPLYKKFENAADHLFSVAYAEIQEAMNQLERARAEGRLDQYLHQSPNLLYSLLTHPKMTPDMVKSVLVDLFIAGVESTSNVLSFLWYELARNPDKQQKLYDEIRSVCGSNDVTKESLAKMSYLKACVKEVMRLYPPTSPGTIRYPEEDIRIAGYKIPAGVEMIIFQQHMCEDSRFFKNPDQFLPERFTRDGDPMDEIRNAHPFATIPFGIGTRSCIGQRFAETEMHIITAKFFQRLEVSLLSNSDKKLKMKYRIFSTPTQNIRLMIKQRLN